MGSREHYSVPRALHRRGALDRLVTELWVRPGSLLSRIAGPRGRGRFHPDLADAHVDSWNLRAMLLELFASVRGGVVLPRTHHRNRWFQRHAVSALRKIRDDNPRAIFAYSYAAGAILEHARERGWKTVLGQIDPGPYEERILDDLHKRHADFQIGWTSAPAEYWDAWKRETELADRIVVNSQWSRKALVGEGIPDSKIVVIPLSFEPPREAEGFVRQYPSRFTRERPLRVLFLGQLVLRKGLVETLEAAQLLRDEPVEFWMVGPRPASLPERFRSLSSVLWTGRVPRSEAAEHYRRADVFLFPTHSDGFGMTQLESLAWKLPVIASRNGGDVITDGENGVLLPEVSAIAIGDALRAVLENPQQLSQYSAAARIAEQYRLDSLAEQLVSLL